MEMAKNLRAGNYPRQVQVWLTEEIDDAITARAKTALVGRATYIRMVLAEHVQKPTSKRGSTR